MQRELRQGTGLGRKGSEQNKCRNEGEGGGLCGLRGWAGQSGCRGSDDALH